MDNLKKNLANRKKEREELQAALDGMYKEFGETQFEYALQNRGVIPQIDEQCLTTWSALREARRQDADTILDIKTAQSRQGELKVFYGEMDKLSRELERNYKKTKEQFILLFFQTYQHDSVPCITQILQDVEPIMEAIEKLEENRKELEQQKSDAHFLKKLAISPQLIALKGKLNTLHKKMESKIITTGEAALTDSAIADVRGVSFAPPLESLYSELVAIAGKQDEMKERKQTIDTEQEKLQETLTECGVVDSPQKRITVLANQIKETDTSIEDAEKRQGILYGDIFYTAEGESTGTPLTGIPEVFKSYLDSIAEYRIKLEKKGLNIEYIENEITLASEVRKIEALQKAIAGYKDGIAQYEKLIKQAQQEISNSEQTKSDVEQRNNELRPLFS